MNQPSVEVIQGQPHAGPPGGRRAPRGLVFVLTFLEAGNAWYSIDQYDPFGTKRAAGIGVRAFLPMFGLLGIDWAWGFDTYTGHTGVSGSQFHFTIGQQF